MGLAGSGKCCGGGINVHIRLCLPDRAQAQHLLGCVWAKLWEGLQPKALTMHYTADKAICEKVSRSCSYFPPLWLLALQICFLVKHSQVSCHRANVCLEQLHEKHSLCSKCLSSFGFTLPVFCRIRLKSWLLNNLYLFLTLHLQFPWLTAYKAMNKRKFMFSYVHIVNKSGSISQ